MNTAHYDSSVILSHLPAPFWLAQNALMECLNPEGVLEYTIHPIVKSDGFILEQHWFSEENVALIFYTTVPRLPYLALALCPSELARFVDTIRNDAQYVNDHLLLERAGDAWLVYDFGMMHSIVPHALLAQVVSEYPPRPTPCAELGDDVDTASVGEGAL